MFLGENIKYLRKKIGWSQQELAERLEVPRSTLGDYERGHTEPNLRILLQLSEMFQRSLDELISSKIHHEKYAVIHGPKLKVLAITVDGHNRQNIEFVSSRAQAGYLQQFSDPDYIRELPKLYFPNIPEGSYRAFEIQGESMLPMPSGSVVICSYLERLEEIRNNRTYVIATHLDGIVYKRVLINPDGHSLTAISDNPSYPPYKIPYRDIDEIWQYYAHLSFTDTRKQHESMLDHKLAEIEETVRYLKEKIQDTPSK